MYLVTESQIQWHSKIIWSSEIACTTVNKNKDGKLALYIACQNGHLELCHILEEENEHIQMLKKSSKLIFIS